MKTKKLIVCLLLASSPFILTGCFGSLALAVAKSAATSNAVKSATLGQQPGMGEVAQKTGEAVRIMSANTSGQGEAIRYIDNPVDDRHPHAEDPLGSDRARVNTMKENLQYLQGLQRKPSHRDDPDLKRRIANIQGQIRGVYINNRQEPPPGFTDSANQAGRDALQHSGRDNLMPGAGTHAPVFTPSVPAVSAPTHTH